ncbi:MULTISPECIES: hypothetical protein [unclassified Streptomyces]|uniref:hypothetical protein n=1 Tax=unclassified Streptomyces TaxID=2593676 RepID=UPI00093946E4|nr:hypothetical protein [Streptomyces sp. TSRI0281]OKI34773.1 hypothetical protein A6A29_15035 [Streptomyces sp. TSRI0281]
MTTEIGSTVGVRQSVTLISPVRLPVDPVSWDEGPIPFEAGGHRTDVAARQTYFTHAAGRALYGTSARPCRWHLFADVTHGDMHLHGMEILRTPTALHPQHALAVLHVTVRTAVLLDVLRALAHRTGAGPGPLSGPLSPQVLLQGIASPMGTGAPFTQAHPYTVAFLTPGEADTPALRSGGPLPPTADRWLWALASRSNEADFPTSPEALPAQTERAVRISADWSALVLRHGTAFLGHRPDRGDGDFYDFAALHVRSVYLDALLLGIAQRDHIDELTDGLSAVFDGAGLARRLTALERDIAGFRSTYWRQHLTAHGPANELLLAYHEQYRLPARFEEILAEAADYSRLVQTQDGQQIAGALGVLTILGLPLGTALSVLQVLGEDDPVHLLMALGAALVATAAAFATRYGRLVLASLRGGPAADE